MEDYREDNNLLYKEDAEEVLSKDISSGDEENKPGIKLCYKLTEEEALSCLKRSGYIKTTGKRAIGETVLLGAVGIWCFISSFFFYGGVNSLVLGIISFLLIGVIWIVPHYAMKHRAREIAEFGKLAVSVCPEEVAVGEEDEKWRIPLDKTREIEEADGLLLIFADSDHMLCIPRRAAEPELLPELEAMLFAGLRKKGEK